jgi:Ser/Thr protein kinase RdoA (MazF antagonist)
MLQIVSAFFDYDSAAEPTPIGKGNINDTYRVDFIYGGKNHSAIIQRLNHQVFKQPSVVMENTLMVCNFLREQEYPLEVPGPLKAKNGAYLVQDEQRNYWRAFPFVFNSYTPEGLATPEVAREAAWAYGSFARALRHFPAEKLTETIPGFHDTDQRWHYFLDILKHDPVGRANGVKPELEALFKAKPLFDFIGQLKRSGVLPLRVAHNDTKAGNVLFQLNTHKALAVIDLDTVMPGTLLSDFGDMVRTFAPSYPEDARELAVVRMDVLKALEEGFLSQTADFITEAEKKYLHTGAAWIIGEQALRFLTDWIAGDVYYKVSYPEHNLVRARNQLSLLKDIKYEL